MFVIQRSSARFSDASFPTARHAARVLFTVVVLGMTGLAMAQQPGFLENPLEFSHESGIGVVSGFHCNAQVIEVKFDDYDPIPAAHGTGRGDTADYCGRTDTGFSLLWNWNILGPGEHLVTVLADGVEFDSAVITVHTFGQEFVYGINAHTDLIVLSQGKEVYLRWQESKQNFVVVGIEESDLTLEALMEELRGDWAGTWHSPGGTGSISWTFVDSSHGTPKIENFQLTGTGCAAGGVMPEGLFNVNEPIFELYMDDGSELELELSATETLSMLGGDFYFDTGPCMGHDGMYYLFRD